MPLLVVPVGTDETDLLSVGELDRLQDCERILFERPDHPLADRLAGSGRPVGLLKEEPPADATGQAVVCEPDSPRLIGWAREGATISYPRRGPDQGLTPAYGAYVSRRAAEAFASLVAIMARLRGPDGCPWDREQDHLSLTVHLQEEAHEVIEAIESGTLGPELEDELGDVLLQVLFHAEMAAGDKRFDISGVVSALERKLVARHPHVFGDVAVSGAGEVLRNWESIKQKEREARGEGSQRARIPSSLPALLTASKVQKQAAGAGVTISEKEARAKATASLAEPPDEETVGEALFWAVALARTVHVDPEGALRRATTRFASSLPEG